jgi:hypothetical protein
MMLELGVAEVGLIGIERLFLTARLIIYYAYVGRRSKKETHESRSGHAVKGDRYDVMNARDFSSPARPPGA